MKWLLILFILICFTGCCSSCFIPHLRDVSQEEMEGFPLEAVEAIIQYKVIAGMTPRQVILAIGDTPCKGKTYLYGSYEETWGYRILPWGQIVDGKCGTQESWEEGNDLFIFFDDGRVVGWRFKEGEEDRFRQ